LATYFGNNANGLGFSNLGSGGFLIRNKTSVLEYTCPGSGNQTIQELSSYVKSNGGTAGYIRTGIYNADGSTLLCSSESLIVDSTSPSWIGTTSPASTSPANYNLVGGTKYILAQHWSSPDVLIAYDGWSDYYNTYEARSYASGFPASLAAGVELALRMCIRCGVDPAASGLSIPVATASGQLSGGFREMNGGMN
jgi:hypothetical protein